MVDLAKLELRVQSLEVQKADARLKKFEASADKAGKSADRFGKRAKGAAQGATALSRSAAGLVRSMAPLIGAFAALAAVRSSIRTLSSFEETLAQVRGIAIKTTASLALQGKQFDLLRNQAAQLGATTRFTATQAGEAQLFLARAGFEVNEILSALPGTLNLAAAGMLDLGTAADIASNVLNQFNLSAEETNRVGDVLINTANSANTNVLQLAEAFKLAGPVAGALNVDLELTAAALGTLGDAGIQASLAGTQLRGILGALSSPTRKAQGILDGLAASLGETSDVFNLTGESIDGVTPSLLRVFDAFKKAGASAQDFFQLFGRRQAAGAIVLTAFVDNARELAESNRNAAGEAERLAKIMEDTLAGAFRSLVSAIEALVLKAGDRGLLGVLRDLVDLLTSTARILGGVGKEADNANEAAQLLAFGIRSVVAGLTALLALQAGSALLALATKVRVAGGAFLFLNAAVAANPFAAAAVAVGILAGAFFSIKAGIEATARAQKELNQEVQKFISTIDSLEEVRARERAAARRDDTERQIRAIRDEIEILKRLQEQIIETGEASISGAAASRFRFERESIIDSIQQALSGVDLTIPFPSPFGTTAEDTARISAAAQRASEIIFGILEQSADDSTFDEKLLDPSKLLALLQQLSGAVAGFFQDEQGGLLPDPDLIAAQARAIRTVLRSILEDIAVPQSAQEALEILDQQIQAAEERIRNLPTLDTRITGEQATALIDFEALREELELAKRLANLTEEQASIERDLLDVRELLSRTGLPEQEIEQRVIAIRTLLEEVEAIKKVTAEREKDRKTQERAQETLNEFIEGLELEAQVAGLSSREKEKARTVEDALALARAAGIQDTKELIELVRREVDARIDLEEALSAEEKARKKASRAASDAAKARERALQDFKNQLGGLTDDIAQLTMTANEFELAQALREAAAAALAFGGNVEEAQDKVRLLVRNIQILRQVRAVAEDISNAFADAFTDVIFGAATAEEAARSFARTVSQALVERLIVAPLVEFLATAITKFAAELLGLTVASEVAGAVLITSANIAADELAAGGVASGAALIAAAGVAAEILIAATAVLAVVAVKRGAVFSGQAGQVTTFRHGGGVDRGRSASIAAGGLSATASGIVNRPTLIPQALLGEGTNPEGVFPLGSLTGGGLGLRAQVRTAQGLESQLLPVTRLADGNLGVTFDASSGSVRRLQFGGIIRGNEGFTLPRGPIKGGVGEDGEGVEFGRAVTIDRSVTVNQTVNARDASGFRESESQIIARLRRGARGIG